MQNGVKPNVRTYTALITALGNAKQWKRAMSTLDAMKHDTSSNHVEPNAYTYSALLKALGEHGQWGIAEKVYPWVHSFLSMIPGQRVLCI